jgi:NAD(P)-dependent dehydrogenase (short-subunit alcohol dehydrogenase family)
VRADHTRDEDSKNVIDLITKQHNRLDILVNNAFAIPKPAQAFFGQPFYTQPIDFFDTVTQACIFLRGHLFVNKHQN